MIPKIILVSAGLICTLAVQAQKDTTKNQAIEITSSYKPVLRNAVKINFSGSQLAADTSKPLLNYVVPAQNLFYAYQPISLKPLALATDEALQLGNRNYVKAGFGSYSTPYIKAGFSLGDGKTALANITGSYIGSKGKDIQYQDYSKLNVTAAASYFLPKQEVYAKVALDQDNNYLYGYDHSIFNYTKNDIQQKFQNITIGGGFKNTAPNALNLNYNPNVQYNIFTSKEKVNEGTFKANIPVTFSINKEFSAKVEATADLTKYSTKNLIPNNVSYTNNILQISPSIIYKGELVNFNAGVTPVSNNGDFSLLPNIYVEAQIAENTFMLQAGWIGHYQKNSYKNLSDVNPWIQPMSFQKNTKETEYYAGLKGTLGSHFSISAKAGFLRYKDFALFITDTASADQKAYKIVYEPTASNVRIHGDINYVDQDKLSLTAGLTLNAYTGFGTNDKAWNTVPMEFTASGRYEAIKKLTLKADFYMFNGGKSISKGNVRTGLNGAADLSLGAVYEINKNFSVWADANNVFNDKYERWNRYPVYGVNFLGGILIKF